MGFTQLDFYPSIAGPFLQKLAHKVFIEGYSMNRIIGRLLVEEITLGRNTAVAVMDESHGWAWFLTSDAHGRPLGIPYSIQCTSCGCLKGIKIQRHSDFDLSVYCRSCRYMKKIQVPQNNFYTREALDGRDGWGIQVLWGDLLDRFPNGKEAICVTDWEDEMKAAKLVAKLAQKEVKGIEGAEDMDISSASG